ncbi:MAG TPA: hypothetical protein VGX03_06980 [Candidatus Binatia bacterium]|jgi:hypothetical protein|nr:hypothetical protein [Candidatus Binatia bacterium]
MTSIRNQSLCTALVLLLLSNLGWAQANPDHEAIALAYHKLSGKPLDLEKLAAESQAVRNISNFDRPDAIKAEVARLQTLLAAADPGHEFVMRVSDNISEYDHNRGEFSIRLFEPGTYVPVNAFGQHYQLAFANAERAHAIPMPKEEARVFDQQLSQSYRSVTNEIHFKVVGHGDPGGAVTGARVIRAELLSSRLLDRTGNVVFTPKITPYQAGSPAAAATQNKFDITRADVAGFRVGVKAKDLEATLTRLFGRVGRSPARSTDWFAGTLSVNQMGCIPMFGRQTPKTGDVCFSAYVDRDDVVRAIKIERIFPWFDAEIFRKAMTQKYGPVASSANEGQQYILGWGPQVDPKLGLGGRNALTARFADNGDFMSRGGNALSPIRVELDLVDAQWVAQARK